ncbi:MAG: cytochrome c3 family protein, partial [Saprospiraceae bacterium]|nr:cytochrome c3 family protein [Saprospiraceae bacterium]
ADTAVVAPKDNTWIYFAIFGLLAILAIVLGGISRGLNRIEKEKEGEVVEKKTVMQLLTSKSVIGVVLFALIVLGGYTTVNNAINLGRQQNYAPDQPIKFSHVTHAGINKIDCQFCHDGARRSKQSVIPPTSTCMNCHKAIKKGSQYGTEEITKIFASIGFDPSTDKYIENYNSLSQKDVGAIYKKWIKNQYLLNEGTSMNEEGKDFVKNQWNSIVSSLTNPNKSKVQGPIEWIRVHNLPDHVYFNHSQHVTVGKIDCANCHGKVAEMETLRQYSPLSMGWCINCHRQTDVQFNENPYYDSYIRYHQELKDGKRDKVTVADVGGLECQKCHY